MTRVRRAGRTTFAAMVVPNYRRYVYGQATSLTGTWMQMTAMSWLVYHLTGSSTILGLIVALQTLPVLLLGPYGGVIADRVDKRRLTIVLQSMMGLQALALGLLCVTGEIHVWEIAILASFLGLNNAFENPARQSFMLELVGPQHLRNAVSLNSVMVNGARSVGPAIAGLLISGVGPGWCFLINGASFIGVIYSLTSMDTSALMPSTPAPRAKGQLREGIAYVRRTSSLLVPLVMMGVAGCLTYEFSVTLPVMASALHGGPAVYGFMTASMGIGAVVGGLFIAARGKTGVRPLIFAAAGLTVTVLAAAVAPSVAIELTALALVGVANLAFMSVGNATMQLNSEPEMRGRVMSLWFVAFQGSTPIGSPIVGAVMGIFGARAGLGLGAVAVGVVTLGGWIALSRAHAEPRNRARQPAVV